MHALHETMTNNELYNNLYNICINLCYMNETLSTKLFFLSLIVKILQIFGKFAKILYVSSVSITNFTRILILILFTFIIIIIINILVTTYGKSTLKIGT